MVSGFNFTPIGLVNPFDEKRKNDLQKEINSLTERLNKAGVSTDKPDKNLDDRNVIEKALNLKQNQGVLFDLLETIDRPREAIAGGIEALAEGENVFGSALEGLTGKKRTSSREAIEKLTGSNLQFEGEGLGSKVGNFLTDVGLDIATDPLTFIPAGAIAKVAGKGAGAVSKVGSDLVERGLRSSNRVARGLGKAGDVARKGAETVGFAFDATKGLLDETIAGVRGVAGKSDTFKQQALRRTKEIRKVAQKLDPNAEKFVLDAIENNVTFGAKGEIKGSLGFITGDEILEDVGKSLDSGTNTILLPRINSADGWRGIRKIVKDLNKASGGDNFELIADLSKSNVPAIKFAGERELFDELIGKIQGGAFEFTQKEINLGARKLSKEAEEFFAKHGDDAIKIVDDTKEVMEGVRDFNTQGGKFSRQEGVSASKPFFGYARHTLSEGAEDFLRNASPAIRGTYLLPGTNKFASRTYRGTARDINEGVKNIYGSNVNLFNDNVIDSVEDFVQASAETYNQTAMADILLTSTDKKGNALFQSLSSDKVSAKGELPSNMRLLEKGSFRKEFSNITKNLPKEFADRLDEMLKEAGAQGKAVGMHKSAFTMMKRFDKAYKDIPAFWSGYDKFLGKWKSLNLISGGFHMRNIMGNGTNMYLAGMNSADIGKFTTEAVLDINKYKTTALKKAQGVKLSGEESKFFDEVTKFFDSGLSQSTAGGRDLSDVKRAIEGKEAIGGAKNVFAKGYNRLEKANFRLSEYSDDIQRYAMWKWGLKKHGGDTAKVGNLVAETLFDYSSLTGFERNVMKRLVPFYTFMKNNLVFQGKNTLKNPQQLNRLGQGFQHYNEDVVGISQEELPDYIANNMWLPIPMNVRKGDKEAISFLKLNLPPAEFAEFIEDPLGRGISSVTMPIKTIFELGTNRSTFTGALIKDFPGQKDRLDEGFLAQFRNSKGNLSITGDPTIEKIIDDLGGRVPRNFASLLTDLGDVAVTDKKLKEFNVDFFERIGITGTKTQEQLTRAQSFEILERLRNLRKRFEQQTGQKLK